MAASVSTPVPTELPVGYYRDNFQVVLDRVQSLYEDLLTDRELRILQTWPTLPLAAQRLLVRLLTRKGRCFRLSKLSYPEIGCALSAATSLASAGLVVIDPQLAPEQYLPLYSKAECLARLSNLPGTCPALPQRARALSRAELDHALSELLCRLPAQQFCAEPILELSDGDWFETFKLLFFGRPGQDLSEFVVRDLGHVRYECYQVDKSLRTFSGRAEVDAQLALHRYCDQAEAALNGDAVSLMAWLEGVPTVAGGDARGCRRWQRVILAGARQLERLGEHQAALDFYSRCDLPPARERRARILAREATSRPQAISLLREMAAAPWDEAERETAHRVGKRLARQLLQPWDTPPKHKPPQEHLFLLRTKTSVELAAATALSGAGDCHYIENWLFNSLFGLLYWPALYAPVRGAFSHPFQAAPLDLQDAQFCSARSTWLDAIDLQLEKPAALEPLLRQRWREKYGTACPFVAWELFEALPVNQALNTIPASHWRAIFRRFLMDPREHRSGLPDLIQFHQGGGYRLLEVKAPGDRLQANQLRWMRYFAEYGIPHGVIQVTWTDGTPSAQA